MAKYTIDISGALEQKLYDYMRENNIKFRSVAIKKCIEEMSNKISDRGILLEIDSKLNSLLYRISLIKKIQDQFFANMGFASNENPKDDEQLQKIYEEYNSRFKGRF